MAYSNKQMTLITEDSRAPVPREDRCDEVVHHEPQISEEPLRGVIDHYVSMIIHFHTILIELQKLLELWDEWRHQVDST